MKRLLTYIFIAVLVGLSPSVASAFDVYGGGANIWTGDQIIGSPARITLNAGTNDDGITFGSLGTGNYAIDMTNVGLSGSADYFLRLNSTNHWRSDGNLTLSRNLALLTTSGQMDFGVSTDAIFKWSTTLDQFLLGIGVNQGRALVLTDAANRSADHDHAVPTNPTLFIHSATSPDTANDEWISLTHDGTDGVIGVGTGRIKVPDITEDLVIQVGEASSPSANPMADGITGMFPVLLADASTEESRHFSIHVPRDWKSGTDITIKFHYMNVDVQTGTNAVIFGIEYVAVADNEDGTPATSISEVTDTLANNEVAEIMHETAVMTIANADIVADDTIGIRMYRKAADGSDTMTGDAAIDGIHVQYTKESI